MAPDEPQPDHDVPAGPEDAGHLVPQDEWDRMVAEADAIAQRQAMEDSEEGGTR
jgi:hypothetical protein